MRTKQSLIGVLILFLLMTACNRSQVQAPIVTVTKKPTVTEIRLSTNTVTATIQPTKPKMQKTIIFDEPTQEPATATEKPTKTPTITPNIAWSYTSTPVPPLEAHEWSPETVLVFLDHRGGDGCCPYPLPPRLILFSDGQLFMRSSVKSSEGLPQLLTKTLNRQEVCALLNTVDQSGFFFYDAETYYIDKYGRPIEYENFPIDGAGYQVIQINAWQSNSATVYGLASFLRDEEEYQDWPMDRSDQPPTILPALKNTYLLLANYEPEDLKVTIPEKVELWIIEPYWGGEVKEWPLEDPSLAYLIENAEQDDNDNRRKIVLEGVSAEKVYQTLGQSLEAQVFTDGQNEVMLYTLPLLPYSTERSDSQPTPTPFVMHCDPTDGQIQLP